MRVVIDQNKQGDAEEILRALSHEVGHAAHLYRPDYFSKQAYVAGTLQEAAALLKNIEARREILAASGGKTDIGMNALAANHNAYDAIYDRYKEDGNRGRAIEDIAVIFGSRETTRDSTGKVVSYEQYYGGWYDKKYGR